MFITKNVNCKKTLKVFPEGKVTDYIKHLIAEYALQIQSTKSLCKTTYLPNFLFNPYFKKNLLFFTVRANFRSLIPPLIRGGDIHYEHILLFIKI